MKFFLGFILVLSLTGCVQRYLVIESEPAGARIFLDSIPVGQSPLTVHFSHYGVRKVVLEKIGYYKETRVIALEEPWYQKPFIGFFADIVWPKEIEDVHHLSVQLDPLTFEDKGLKQRAEKEKRKFENETN